MLQGEHSAILSTFIKLAFVIKIFVLSIFEWPLKTGFTVFLNDNHFQIRTPDNGVILFYNRSQNLRFLSSMSIFEQLHVISNSVAFLQVLTQTSLRSLLLRLETPNCVRLVA